MIVKRPDGYHVMSHTTGKNLGGPYATEEQAQKRLAQIRKFKYMKKTGAEKKKKKKVRERTFLFNHPEASYKELAMEAFGPVTTDVHDIDNFVLGYSPGERYVSAVGATKKFSTVRLKEELKKAVLKDRAFTPTVAAMYFELKHRGVRPPVIVKSYLKEHNITEREYIEKLKPAEKEGSKAQWVGIGTALGAMLANLGLGTMLAGATPHREEVKEFADWIKKKHGLATKLKVSGDSLGSHFIPKTDEVVTGGSRAIASHEFGHARNLRDLSKRIGRRAALAYGTATYQTIPILPGALGQVPLAGLLAMPFISPSLGKILKGKKEKGIRYKVFGAVEEHPIAISAATTAPKLYEEASASVKGLADLAHYAPAGQKVREVLRGAKILGPAFGTYATAAALPIGLGASAYVMHKALKKQDEVTKNLSRNPVVYIKKHASFLSFIKTHPVGTGVSVLGGAVLGAGLAKRKEIKEEVGENVRNLTYLGKHKYDVYKGGRALDLPRRQLIKHDYTKLYPSILNAYTNWFQSDKGLYGSKDPETYRKFRIAADKHYKLEMHHANKIGKPKPMKYWLESVADSYAVNKVLSKDKKFPNLETWFKNLPEYKWRPDVRKEVNKHLTKTAGPLLQLEIEQFKKYLYDRRQENLKLKLKRKKARELKKLADARSKMPQLVIKQLYKHPLNILKLEKPLEHAKIIADTKKLREFLRLHA